MDKLTIKTVMVLSGVSRKKEYAVEPIITIAAPTKRMKKVVPRISFLLSFLVMSSRTTMLSKPKVERIVKIEITLRA